MEFGVVEPRNGEEFLKSLKSLLSSVNIVRLAILPFEQTENLCSYTKVSIGQIKHAKTGARTKKKACTTQNNNHPTSIYRISCVYFSFLVVVVHNCFMSMPSQILLKRVTCCDRKLECVTL